jgi:hypothetical protein
LPIFFPGGLSSSDGNVILFNLHISSQRSLPIEFSDTEIGLPDEFAKLLFNMSSHLPEYMRNIAQKEGFKVSENTKGFVFNADIVAIIRFLDIGKRAADER